MGIPLATHSGSATCSVGKLFLTLAVSPIVGGEPAADSILEECTYATAVLQPQQQHRGCWGCVGARAPRYHVCFEGSVIFTGIRALGAQGVSSSVVLLYCGLACTCKSIGGQLFFFRGDVSGGYLAAFRQYSPLSTRPAPTAVCVGYGKKWFLWLKAAIRQALLVVVLQDHLLCIGLTSVSVGAACR